MLIRSLSYSPTSATTQSGNTVIIAYGASSPAPTEPTATTTGSPVCPSANGTTYTVTNKPVRTFLAETELTNSSFKFEIVCNTNYFGGSITGLQTMSNVSSIGACMDACALYSWQVSPGHFAALGCTRINRQRVLHGVLHPVNSRRPFQMFASSRTVSHNQVSI